MVQIKSKKAMAPLLMVVSLMAGLITIGLFLGVLDVGSLFGGFDANGVYVSEDGRLECNKDQAPQTIIKYADDNYFFGCGKGYLVDSCQVIVKCESSGFFEGSCIGSYRINDGKEGYKVLPQSQYIINLKSGDNVQFYSSFTNSQEGNTKLTYTFNPYRLYTVERGGKYISSSADCSLANQRELERKQFKYGDWDALGKGESRNYFLGWNKIYGAKVYGDKICLDTALYSLDKTKLSDGSEVNVQGSKIRNVECCPHQDNNCGDDFEFKQKEQERECSYDYQCANTGNPYDNPFSSTTAYQERCISGQCVESNIDVECDSDAKCRQLKGDGYGCDLSYDNYGKCIKVGQIEQPRCGDQICQTGETKDDCPSDCTLECPEGYKQITTTSYSGSLCFFGKGLCDKKTSTECQKSGANWVLWLSIALILILIFIFKNQIIAGTKWILGRFGI